MHFNIKRAEPVHETYSGSKSREIWRVKIQVKSLIFIKTHFWAEYQRKCFIIVLFMFNIIHLVQSNGQCPSQKCTVRVKQNKYSLDVSRLKTQEQARAFCGILGWKKQFTLFVHYIWNGIFTQQLTQLMSKEYVHTILCLAKTWYFD